MSGLDNDVFDDLLDLLTGEGAAPNDDAKSLLPEAEQRLHDDFWDDGGPVGQFIRDIPIWDVDGDGDPDDDGL